MDDNRKFDFTVGETITQKNWKGRAFTWDEIRQKLHNPRQSDKTYREYTASQDMRNAVKASNGGYVAGTHAGGRGRAVMSRSVLTVDMDTLDVSLNDLTAHLRGCLPFCWLLHSTASHSEKTPKARLLIPLAEDLADREQYEACIRIVSETVGMHRVDWRSIEWGRVMYWPVRLADVEYYIQENYTERLATSRELLVGWYEGADWRNFDTRPVWPHEGERVAEHTHKAADPDTKEGIIGAFCRTYSISEAIEKFIPDAYQHVHGNRWKYLPASSMAGAVVYDDKLMWSNHASDPACGHARNAFDLVRIHRFLEPGATDEGAAYDRSVKEMKALAERDTAVNRTLIDEQVDGAKLDFSGVEGSELEAFKDLVKAPDSEDWRNELKITKGVIDKSIENCILFIENALRIPFFKDTFGGGKSVIALDPKWEKPCKPRRWNGSDDDMLMLEMSRLMGGYNPANVMIAKRVVENRRSRNTLQDSLRENAKEYPGRNDKLLEEVLINCVGAEDTPLVRSITKKFLIGMVARAMEPGCKMDNALMLIGKGGHGKSTFANWLGTWKGEDRFSDSFSFSKIVRGKEGYEGVKNKWVIEVGEFSKEAKVVGEEAIKKFISSTSDHYRPSHERSDDDFPRSCVFIMNANPMNPLSTSDGSRRFWGVRTERFNIGAMIPSYLDRIYAAAYAAYICDEPWYMDKNEEEENELNNEMNFEEENPLDVTIRHLLEEKVPEGWKKVMPRDKYDFFFNAPGTEKRTRLTWLDVAVLGLGYTEKDLADPKNKDLPSRINTRIKKITGWERATLRYGLHVIKGFKSESD